ncbi:conserved hypothetical protein [Trichormus variabilis ATCC 29413]|uniref:Uncharacterized protein n=2 Tax=Anabaena variabilis TaxID=264691 RepID=Q3MAY0_TRIV2|nr:MULTISPECIES: hypothetical protein [Nostocaceae]ABA21856.1 conserved hypothetical protein [Trichormus variabilis ATCC 29413]MBC1214575.1 hypothetical protein [Trichormus variabilis ARAD]MBC1254353.1 hypothetical protein [Trichormus variabilis V5]MBC1266787.1 hypothetical protein [Trichormus variabilis FSR]MBC1302653.1 hypothetical protein [Trichormus variabilis N2B]
MTTSVADKTPTPAKVWRRHNDPPGLWFAVALGSASLHLLAFWLIRSSSTVGLWFPQQDQSVVPIELIEVTPQTNSTDKPASSPPEQSVSNTTTAQAPPTSTNQDAEIITSGEQSQPDRNNLAPSKTEVFSQAESTTTPIQTTEPEPTPTQTTQPEPKPTPTVPVGELPWNRREEIELGQGKPLPSDIPPVTPEQVQQSETVEDKTPRDNEDTPDTSSGETTKTPTENNSATPNSETANTPFGENSQTPTGETAKIPTEQYTPTPTEEPANTPTENNANSTARGAIATLAPLTESEARQLVNDLPEVLSAYQGSSSKTVDSSYLPGDSPIKPAQLLASLVIDKNGNVQQAIILKMEPASLQSEKSLYEQLVGDLFKNENFTPGHNRDGSKPDFSNFFVRVTIEPTGQ